MAIVSKDYPANQDFYPINQSESEFIRYGYVIVGWNTCENRDKTTPQYPIGTKIDKRNTNLDLYACWSETHGTSTHAVSTDISS